MQADPSWGQFRFVRFNGTNIERQTVEHNMGFGCDLVLDQDDPTHGYAAGSWHSPDRIVAWEYNGGLNGWTYVIAKTVGLASQSVGVALWVESIEFTESVDEVVTAVDTVTVETERFSADWLTYQENTEVWTDRTEPDGPKHEPPAVEEGGSGAIAYHASYHLIYYLLDPVGTNKPEFWIHKRLNNSWRMLQPQVFGTPEVDYPTWGSTDEAVASCWDGNNDRVLIYARRFSDDAPDLWAWDQQTFTRLTASVTGLPTVTEPQLAWDPDTQTMWLYCYDAGIPGYRIFQLNTDTLTFTEKTVGGTEGTDYPAGRRRGCGFAYDPNLQELILSHGGVSPTLYSDTWSFNGTRWMRRTPSGIEGVAYPETRTRCSLVTGPNDDLYLVGGRSAAGVRLRDTWRWQGDLLNWEKKVADATSNEFIKPNMRTCGRWPLVPKKCQEPIRYDFEFRSDEVVDAVDAVQETVVSDLIAYIAGTPGTVIKKYKEGSWSDLSAGVPYNVYSLSGKGEDDLWCGIEYGFSGPWRLYHWNGTIWTEQTLPDQTSAISNRVHVDAWSDQIVYAIGINNGNYRIWRTTNGGGTWSTLDTATLQNYYVNNMVVVGPNEVYFSGSSGATSNPRVGVWKWTPGGGLEVETTASGLPRQDPDLGYNVRYEGITADRSTGELWVMDDGQSGGPSKLYRGQFGGPWTLAIRFDNADGYGANNYNIGSSGRAMVMDELGILTVSMNHSGVDPDVVMQGDPRLAQPSLVQVANPGTSNVGSGEKAAQGGHYLMTDNGDGLLYDKTVGSWVAPPNGTWGGGKGAAIVSG
jgi:hypothetical protein